MLLYDLMSKGNVVDVEEAFFKLLDENTPYYQDVFRLLSGEKRKVFDTLLEIGPATPKAIAEKARLDNKTVNTLLRRLEKDGYVRSRQRGRTTKYEERERLFRLWRELRREPFAKQKLSILIEFLELWYSEEEREKRFLELLKDLKEALDEKREREASYWLSSLPKEYKRGLIPQVIEEIYEVGKAKLLDELIYGDRELKAEASKVELRFLFEKGNYEEVLKKAEEMIKVEESNASAWYIKGLALGSLERYEEALEALLEFIKLNPENANAWLFKGLALDELERYEEALEAFSKSIELNHERADLIWHIKGLIHLMVSHQEYERNNYGNAEENLNSALDAFDSSCELSKDKVKAKEEIHDHLMTFLKALIETKNVEAVKTALNAIYDKKDELKEFFEPISIALEVVESKDVRKYYDLQVERRELVADIVKKLTGSDELVPEEYRG
jgi:hypothetical protein